MACFYRNKLIFENAVNKNASLPPPRPQTNDLANPRNIQQFTEMKNKRKLTMFSCLFVYVSKPLTGSQLLSLACPL